MTGCASFPWQFPFSLHAEKGFGRGGNYWIHSKFKPFFRAVSPLSRISLSLFCCSRLEDCVSGRVGRTSGPQVVLCRLRLLQRSQLPGLCCSKRGDRAHGTRVMCWCPQLMSRGLLTLSPWVCGFYTLPQVSSVSWSPRHLYPLFFFVPSSPFHLSACVAVCEVLGGCPRPLPQVKIAGSL